MSSYLIEAYIIQKLVIRSAACANIVSKFEVFDVFLALSNFQLLEVTFVPLHLLGSWTPLSSREVFLDRNVS